MTASLASRDEVRCSLGWLELEQVATAEEGSV